MKIAIVDDQPEDLNSAKIFLNKYLAKKIPISKRKNKSAGSCVANRASSPQILIRLPLLIQMFC